LFADSALRQLSKEERAAAASMSNIARWASVSSISVVAASVSGANQPRGR